MKLPDLDNPKSNVHWTLIDAIERCLNDPGQYHWIISSSYSGILWNTIKTPGDPGKKITVKSVYGDIIMYPRIKKNGKSTAVK